MLGKPVAEVPDNYERGELLVDTAMDLETNATKGLARENSLMLQRGRSPTTRWSKWRRRSAPARMTSSHGLRGMFLDDEQQTSLDDLNDVYVLVNFRPAVTKKNWRMDCGVAGYDNRFGLPPFFPTRLRFEDYIYRLWVQQDGVPRPTSTRPRTTPRATTCATRRPRRFSTRRWPICSSGRSRPR